MPGRTGLLRLYYFLFFGALGAYLPFFPSWLEAHGIRGFAMSTIAALWPLLGIVSPVLFGVAAGCVGAVAVARAMQTLLYGLAPLDGVSFATSAALLIVASIVAAAVPARRAAGVDPLQSLRSD